MSIRFQSVKSVKYISNYMVYILNKMSETNTNDQNDKTSLELRTYQKHYYKKRMEKQKQLESLNKLSGGDILAQSMNENIDSDDDYKIPAIHLRLSSSLRVENPIRKANIEKNVIKSKNEITVIDIKPQINKEQIVNFKLKKAISWISQNVQ